MSDTVVETPRLVVRRFSPFDDAAAMEAVYCDPEVMRFVPGGAVAAASVPDVLARHVAANATDDLGFYAVVERATSVVVGEVGFGEFDTGEREIGWTFARAHWGRGYASEAVRACIDARAESLVAAVDARNLRSIKLAERLGFRRRELRELHGHPHVVLESQAR